MFQIGVFRHFSSAHLLRGYQGKCETLHGHNWKVEAQIQSDVLDSLGMVMDFKDLKAAIDDILNELDHTFINDHPYFKIHNPSSEEIAKYIFDCLEKKLDDSLVVASVKVWESPNSFAIYSKAP